MALEILVGEQAVERKVVTDHHANLASLLPMWTIVERPVDFPTKWVARLGVSLPQPMATNMVIIGDDYAEVMHALPKGLARIPRSPQDEPHIVEVWL